MDNEELMKNMPSSSECYLLTRFLLSDVQRVFLMVYAILINGLANFVLNSLVIATLVKTKQYRSPAMRIMLYISISDICLSFATPIVYTLILTKYKKDIYCPIEISGTFLLQFLGNVSALHIGLLVFDRYARITYMQKYRSRMSKRKINQLTVMAVCLALFNAGLTTVGAILGRSKEFTLAVFAIDGIVVCIMVVLLVKAMRTLNRHCHEMHSNRLENIRLNIVSLTKAMLLTVIIFYTIYLATNSLHLFVYDKTETLYWKGMLEFWLLFGILLGLTNSAVNAILFLVFNRESHKLIRGMTRRGRRQSTVAAV